MKTSQSPFFPKTARWRGAVRSASLLPALGALFLLAVLAAACAGGLGKAASVPVATLHSEPTREAALPVTATRVPDAGTSVSGNVMDASASARIIMLEHPDHGISTIALTDATVLLSSGGEAIALTDISHGDSVKAHGHSGTPGTLLADKIIVGAP
jgi:hypothetical protein